MKELISPIDQYLCLWKDIMTRKGTLYVRGMTANVMACEDIDLDGVVRQLRTILQWKYGHPPESGYGLLFCGKWLQDSDILSEKGVEDGTQVYMLIKPRKY